MKTSETVIRFESGDIGRYRSPTIRAAFKSRLVNRRNYELSSAYNEAGQALRVVAGLKPTAFLSGSHGEMRDAAYAIRAAGGHARVEQFKSKRAVYFCSATIAGRVGEAFDMDALTADYRAYLRRAPKAALLDVERELRLIAARPFSAFLDFSKVEVERRYWKNPARPDPGRPGSWARCGLLLGYPVPTTVANILQDLGLGTFVRHKQVPLR
jgi:hypothetical protein